MSWQDGGYKHLGRRCISRLQQEWVRTDGKEESTPEHKGKEKQIAAIRHASQRLGPTEPLKTYSRTVQVSTDYRIHSA